METKNPQPSGSPSPPHASHGHGHGHSHTGRRLRKLLRENGRRVHIASTPEEHIHLKRYVNWNI